MLETSSSQVSNGSNEVDSLRDDLLAIITEFAEKNRTAMLDNLVTIALKRTGVRRATLENLIDRLIQENVIVPGTRIIRRIILSNETRKDIYQIIKQYPGVNVNSIKTKLELGSNSVLWHLSVLVKFGLRASISFKIFHPLSACRISPRMRWFSQF